MDITELTFVYLILIGIVVGATYSLLAKEKAMPIGKSFFYSITGALLGGVLSAVIGLGAYFAIGVVFSLVVLFLGHLMAKRVEAERKREKELKSG